MFDRLGKSNTRIEDELLDPKRLTGPDLLPKIFQDTFGDVLIVGHSLHGLGRSAKVHEYIGKLMRRRYLADSRVELTTTDVIDHVHAGLYGSPGHLRLKRIDGEKYLGEFFAYLGEQGYDPGDLFRGTDRFAAGTSALPSQIQYLCPLSELLLCEAQALIDLLHPTDMVKRVGGAIQDAHHDRLPKLQNLPRTGQRKHARFCYF